MVAQALMQATWNCFAHRSPRWAAAALCVAAGLAGMAQAQVPTFAGDAQHTSNYAAPAQNMNAIRWWVSIDETPTGAFVHYGSPLVTASSTVITGIRIAGDAFKVSAFVGATGTLKYTLTSDYVLPSHNWVPAYNPAIVSGPWGTRLYYAGAGGTIFHVDNIDSNSPGIPVREVFYTSLSNYLANASTYNSTVFINTPITSDANGNVFFGFRQSTAQSGYARIDANGTGTYVLVDAATGDANITRDCHNTAPALSNDGTTLYVVAKSASTANYGYLVALNSTTLATKYPPVFLRDPRNNNGAGILDDGTASPMVAPDGDVFLGVMGNPYNGSRGWLLHFTGDLSVQKPPGAFGWDFTPGIVPTSMVPGYNGPSTYLLAAKYNNYANVTDGDGINKIAILDPNATQTDFHATAPGQVEMREVLTIIGPTPDAENPTVPNAIREWCVNAPAVNPATNSVFVPSEDGHIYRWNLAENSVTQSIGLTAGVGEPYVPTVIGPDGTVYTLNGGYLFALGGAGTASLTLDSSAPSVRSSVAGDSITFTANLASGGPAPTGTVTFSDLTFNHLTPVTSTLAANVPVNGSGHASVTTSALQAGGTFLGNHWITASYGGDSNFPPKSITRLQKIHAYRSATAVTSSRSPSPYGGTVTFSATVTSQGGVPSGYVTFLDGSTVIGQTPLNTSGLATFATSTLGTGTHTITASYYSDTQFASSLGSLTQTVGDFTPPLQVTGVTATSGPPKRQITVKWKATTDPDDAVAVYLVYSSGSQNGTYTLLASVTTLSYANVFSTSGIVRWYYVVARDTAGNLSLPSAKVSAKSK